MLRKKPNLGPASNSEDEALAMQVLLLAHEVERLKRQRESLDHEIARANQQLDALRDELIRGQRVISYKNASAPVPEARLDWFEKLPDEAYLRATQIARRPGAATGLSLLPVSTSTFWKMVADGRFPKPIKLGPKLTAWRVREVREWLVAKRAGPAMS